MIKQIIRYLNLEHELDDYEMIHNTIAQDSIFKGTNLWILVFAIVVASVGLNMNSTAVIIGAMLISPLMGPINGMGYSLATYNFELFRKAVKHFTFAVIASLIASTLYFSISPVSTAHSELLARTSPTIYDVVIALFGGMAGIIAISSKKKGNVIPGVAIATALMPPLCTAGYGIATAQLNFFLGAIYLFTINTVFIALSSVAVSQFLKFPIRASIEDSHKKKINRLVTLTILITIIPSIYFGYGLVENEKFSENAGKYINNISIVEGSYLLKSEIDPPGKSINLIYGGNSLTEEKKSYIIQKKNDFSLENAKVEFKQGFSFEDINLRSNEMNGLKAEINKLKNIINEKEKQEDSLLKKKELGKSILKEIRIMYPFITNASYSETYKYSDTTDVPIKVAYVVINSKIPNLPQSDKDKVNEWLKLRLNSSEINVFYVEAQKK